MRDFGIPPPIVSIALNKDPEIRDNAGLREAVDAARGFLAGVSGELAPQDASASQEVAEAEVTFDQLRCHMEENRLHYSQAVWLREDHGQRFLRLQAYGPIANLIENELIGFYADKAAYPLRRIKGLQDDVDLADVLADVDKLIAEGPPPSMLVTMPTPGTLMEAIVGECDACETYIRDSRAIDLREQAARASQAEVEAVRRQTQIDQGDLTRRILRPLTGWSWS